MDLKAKVAKSMSASRIIEVKNSDEDCVIVDPTQIVFNDVEKIIARFYNSTSITDLDACLENYYSAIKEGLASFKGDNRRFLLVGLNEQIDRIYSIYANNKAKYTLIDSYYYWHMEDLLVLYCNLELKVYADRIKADATIRPGDVVVRICKILYKTLDRHIKHIMNVMLRFEEKYFNMNFSPIINSVFKRAIITEYHLYPRVVEADEFCRISLIIELWKTVRKQEEHSFMDDAVYVLSNWTKEELEKHDKLMYILKENIDQGPSGEISALQVRIQRFFHTYGERVAKSLEMTSKNHYLSINDEYTYARTKLCDEMYLKIVLGTGNLDLLEPAVNERFTWSRPYANGFLTDHDLNETTSDKDNDSSTNWLTKLMAECSESDFIKATETNLFSPQLKPLNVDPLWENLATPDISFRSMDLSSSKCIYTRQRKKKSKSNKFGRKNVEAENFEDMRAHIDELYDTWQQNHQNVACCTNNKDVLADEDTTAGCSADSLENSDDMEFFFWGVPHEELHTCNDQRSLTPRNTVAKTDNDSIIIEDSVTEDPKLPTPVCHYNTIDNGGNIFGDTPDSPHSMIIVCDDDKSHLGEKEKVAQEISNNTPSNECLQESKSGTSNPVEKQKNNQPQCKTELNSCASPTGNNEHNQVAQTTSDLSQATETSESGLKVLYILPHDYLQATVKEQVIYVKGYKIICQAPRIRSVKQVEVSKPSDNVPLTETKSSESQNRKRKRPMDSPDSRPTKKCLRSSSKQNKSELLNAENQTITGKAVQLLEKKSVSEYRNSKRINESPTKSTQSEKHITFNDMVTVQEFETGETGRSRTTSTYVYKIS